MEGAAGELCLHVEHEEGYEGIAGWRKRFHPTAVTLLLSFPKGSNLHNLSTFLTS